MTPGTLDITLYRGSRFSETLEIVDTDTGLPYDLTSYGPFYGEVRAGESAPVLVTIAVTLTAKPTDGLLNLEADVSIDVPLRTLRWGIIDADGQMWIVGKAKIESKIPKVPKP